MSAIALILAAAGASAAAPATEKSDATSRETRQMIHRYGDCIMKEQQKRAATAIRANADNSELLKRYSQLIDGQCMPALPGQVVKVRFEGDQFRYAIADALVRREFADAASMDFEPVAALDHRVPTPPSRTNAKGKPLRESDYQDAVRGYEQAEAFSYLSRYGECVVRVNPQAAHALLMTEPETPQEGARFAAMSNALGTCMAEGRTLAFSKMSLRGTIAVNYYRLASAARQLSMSGAPR